MSKLVQMLKVHEGVKSHAYVDTVGKITIGVGRNIDFTDGLGLSDREIEFLLVNDIERVEEEITSALPWTVDLLVANSPRYDALVDLCFNLGLPRFLNFVKALDACSEGDWDKAADEFLDSRWATQVGNRATEIAAMIRTGEYQESYGS